MNSTVTTVAFVRNEKIRRNMPLPANGASTPRRSADGNPLISIACGADSAMSIGAIMRSNMCWIWCIQNRWSAIPSIGDSSDRNTAATPAKKALWRHCRKPSPVAGRRTMPAA
jgi:hypothetical protein